jgi:lipoprotein-anchoring transpeptidase ErfK/SrfK
VTYALHTQAFAVRAMTTLTAQLKLRPLRSPARFAGLVAVVLVAVLAAAYVYDHSRSDLIAPGVRAAGVDVGGLRADKARAVLERDLPRQLERSITVTAAGHHYRIATASAHPRIDIDGLVKRAEARSRSGWFAGRAVDGITGARVNADVSAPVTYSHRTLNALAARVAAKVDRTAVDASVKPSTNGLTQVRSHSGRRLDAAALQAGLAYAVTHPGDPRRVQASVTVTHPHVTTSQLAAKYPNYIIVDRGGFKLRYYHHLQLAKTYSIAVGMQGLETPAGLYDIQWKQVNPPWYVPNSSWAGSLAGQTIPPGPRDPLKARFMAFNGGAGIHGIDPSEYGTIGHDASHGCVRMTIPDVIDLYKRVPVHTPVYVA